MEITTPEGWEWRGDSIFVYPTDWLVNMIDKDGYFRINREADHHGQHQGKKAKVIAVEALNDTYSAVRISAWGEDKKEELAV